MPPDVDPTPSPRHSLTVLPHSGKVDQLRRETPRTPPAPAVPAAPAKAPAQQAVEEKVIAVLRTVYDPELPVNIYDLGLIYSIDVAADNRVKVLMTLTAPACPVAGTLPPEVERRIETIEEVPSATVEVVWDPPWSKDRMSEAALLELGLS